LIRLEDRLSHSVSVVIPAYFEEKTIADIVKRCLPYADEVLVVNDGSTDDTSVNAKAAGARVVELPENMGVLGATQVGLHEATGDIIVTIDADGQHDPSEIPGVIEQIIEGKAELVMGTRPSFPYLSEKVLTWLTSLKVPVGDASTGFRAVTKEVASKMKLHGRCMCGTFVLEAVKHGARVASVSISIREREQGNRRIQSEHIAQFFIILKDLLGFW
jgi:glycosyltransferase involved in cell wall biosynthesis